MSKTGTCPHCGVHFDGWLAHPRSLPGEDNDDSPLLAPIHITLRHPHASRPSVTVEANSTIHPWLRLPEWLIDELQLNCQTEADRYVSVELEGEVAVLPFDVVHDGPVLVGRNLDVPGKRHAAFGPSKTSVAEIGQVYWHARRAKERSVLVLGQDTSRLPVLREIQAWLSIHDYTSVVVKDLADIEEQSIEEKVMLLASLARFVVCDDATASGHIDELRILAGSRLPTAVLNPVGAGGTWMQADYGHDFNFIQLRP